MRGSAEKPLGDSSRSDRAPSLDARSILTASRALGLFYLALSLAHLTVLEGQSARIMSGLAGASALALFAVSCVAERRRATLLAGDATALFVTAIVLTNSLAQLAIEARPRDSINVFLLLVGSAYFVRSPICFGSLVATTLAGWATVAHLFVPELDFVHYGSACLLTLGVAFVLFDSKRALVGDIGRVRDADRAKSAQLESVLCNAREELEERRRLVSHLRDAEERNATIIEFASCAVFLVDEVGRITEANSAATEIFGFQREELVGRKLTETIIPDSLRSEHEAGFARFIQTRESRYMGEAQETRGRHADGHEVPVEMILRHFVSSTGHSTFAGFVSDLSERKRVEERLREAEDGSREKSRFLALMSHEIRTPLSAIVGLTDIALEGLEGGRTRDLLERSRGAGEYLSAMLGDLLDLAKVEVGQLEVDIRPLAPRHLLEDACAFLGVRAAEQGIDLILEVGEDMAPSVLGDATRMRQVVTNLVSNAIKFTLHGWIRVAMYASEGRLHIDVEDTGVGVAPELRERIFDEFAQGESAEGQRFDGSGLGLAISRKLAGLMGGTVTYEPRPGGGSIFSFVLPHEPVESSTYRADLSEARIVLALPNPHERAAVARNLAPFGPRVESVGCPDELRELIQEETDGSTGRVTTIFFDLEAFPFSDCPAPGCNWIAVARSPAAALPEFASSLLTRPLGPRSLVRAIKGRAREARAFTDVGPEPDVAPARFLVVEDNEINQFVLAEALGRRGHRVDVASNGVDGLEMFGRGGYDAILLDLEMPGFDGFETLARIRSDADRGKTPVIAVTAYATQDMRERTIEGGFDGFVSKPIQWRQFFEVLAAHLPGIPCEERAVAEASCEAVARSRRRDAIDRETLLRYAFGELEIVCRLSEIFARRAPEYVAVIREASDSRSEDLLCRALHKLRGTLADIGAKRALGITDRMSELVHDGQAEAADSLVDELEREVQAAIEDLKELVRAGL